MTNQKNKPTPEEYEKLGRSVESALVNDYINWLGNTRRQVFASLVRGIFTGLGTVIGATVGVALLVWILYMLAGVIPGAQFLKDTGNQIEQKTQQIQEQSQQNNYENNK